MSYLGEMSRDKYPGGNGKCPYTKEKSACHSLAITGQLLSICHLLDSTSLPSNGETTLLINSLIFDATAGHHGLFIHFVG